MPPILTLNDGHPLPAIGFGLYKVDPAETEAVVTAGIEAGYPLIDGGAFYENEREVGRAVRASGRQRIATKACLAPIAPALALAA